LTNEQRACVVVLYNTLPESPNSLLVANDRILTGVKPSTNKDLIFSRRIFPPLSRNLARRLSRDLARRLSRNFRPEPIRFG